MMWRKKHQVLIVTGCAMVVWYIALGLNANNLAMAASPNNPKESERVNSTKAQEEPVVAEWADGVLREMGDYLKAADQFSFHMEVTFDNVLPSGQKLQYAGSVDASVRRPNRLYSEFDGDLRSTIFWYDGENFTFLDRKRDVYSTQPSPPTLDATVDHIMDKYGFSIPLSDLAFSDPYASLMENVHFGLYVGLHSVDGVRSHHLAFVKKHIDWQIWIEDGKQPVPRKMVITYKTLPGSPQYTAVFSEWDMATRLPDSLFVVDAPAIGNANQIEFLENRNIKAGQKKSERGP
jgi:hypothetical protein